MILGKYLPKVIEKSQEEIEETISLVQSSNLPEEIKPFVIGCINLASWIPKALVEHKITVSNLKRLLFGKGAKTTQKQSPAIEKPEVVTDSEKLEASNQAPQEDKKSKGHGRMHHTVYSHANEHTIPLESSLCPGESCPSACGGKLYRIPPGILVNIKGQNLASINKYWIEKLRCALCNEVFSATIPKQVCKEKYHPSFKAMLALQKYYMNQLIEIDEKLLTIEPFQDPELFKRIKKSQAFSL